MDSGRVLSGEESGVASEWRLDGGEWSGEWRFDREQ